MSSFGGFSKVFFSQYDFSVTIQKPLSVNAEDIVRQVADTSEQAEEVLEKIRAEARGKTLLPMTYQKQVAIDGKTGTLSSRVSSEKLLWVISFPLESGINFVLSLSGPVGFPQTLEIFERFLLSFKFLPPSSEKQSNAKDAQQSAPAADLDGDGLTESQEKEYGTNENKFDTDGDGYGDGDEVKGGYNPNGSGKTIQYGN